MKPAMVIDLNRCVGCFGCVEACISENIARWGEEGLIYYPDNVVRYSRTRPFWIEYGDTRRHVFIQCMHCANAPCVNICPTGASYRNEDGLVLIDYKKCIKCMYCVNACPYQVRTVFEGELPGEMLHEEGLHIGFPDKCTLCIHRKEGEKLWTPACVEACPYNARLIGDLENPNDEVTRLVRQGIAVAPRKDLGTEPKLFFVPKMGGAELSEYPVRPRDVIIPYNVVSDIKESLLRPLFLATTGLAVVFGFIHMIRSRGEKDED